MRSLTLSKLALGLFALVSAAPVALSAVSVALPAPIDDL